MRYEDHAEYLKYTGPSQLDKAIHSLEGIVRGISIDGRVNRAELETLLIWLKEHQQYETRHPFNEVMKRLNRIVQEEIVDEEACADILWLCDRFSTENRFYGCVSADMQRLHGLMAGIAADGEITAEELQGLRKWMDQHQHLRTIWPYDELESLIVSVLADGVIDAREHQALMMFFQEFFLHTGHQAIDLPAADDEMLLVGVCAASPEIRFVDRIFCFTGSSERVSRQALAEQVRRLGGAFSSNMTKQVDYLIVGADGNPCWAYACYGRKVEKAVQLRKQGSQLLIVHEYDYWDALAEQGLE
jgi:NAD-dependent DNA ligase